MSAVLAVQYGDRVQVLADAFRVNDAAPAVLAKVRSKIWTSKPSRIAVSGRGSVPAFAIFGRGIAINGFMLRSFDRTFERIEADLADAKRKGRVLPFAEVFVAGISETRGPMIRCFYTSAHGHLEPFRLYHPVMSGPTAPFFYAGPPIPNLMFRLGAGLDATGAAIMDQARATAAVDPIQGGDPIFAVGGFAELVTIDATGITRQRVREWPEDKVGEKIDPTRREAA